MGSEAAVIDKPAPTKLYTALHKARASMSMVAKGGENKFDKYKYATLADYLEAIQKPLDDNGLIVVSHIDEINWLQDRETKGGGFEKVCRIMLRTTVIHAESGESLSVTVLGEGQDRGDKAFYKADTGARKYALANLFNLATDDDPETDSPGTNGSTSAAQPTDSGVRPRASTKQNQPAPSAGRRGTATANLTPPPKWPDTPVDDLKLWIEGALSKPPHFEFALGLFQSEAGLIGTLEEWEPVLRQLAESYKARIKDGKMNATVELNQKIKDALDKLELDKQGVETFQPKEEPSQEATA